MKAIITIHTEYGEDFISRKTWLKTNIFKEVISLLKIPDDYEVAERTIIIHLIFFLSQ